MKVRIYTNYTELSLKSSSSSSREVQHHAAFSNVFDLIQTFNDKYALTLVANKQFAVLHCSLENPACYRCNIGMSEFMCISLSLLYH